MFYQDAFGVQVVAGDFAPQAPMKRLPGYLVGEEGLSSDACSLSHPIFAMLLSSPQQKGNAAPAPPKKDTPFSKCLKACRKLDDTLRDQCQTQHEGCLKAGKPEKDCDKQLSDCIANAGEIALGCFRRCHDIPAAPSAPKLPPILGVRLDIPTDKYDQCYPGWKDKIPGLPEPPKKK